jgi:hypothetical protein
MSQDNLLPFTEGNVWAIIDVYPPGASDLVEEVLEEGIRRSLWALDVIWEAVGLSPDNSIRREAEEHLRHGGRVEVFCLPEYLFSPDEDEDEEYLEEEEEYPDEEEDEEDLKRKNHVEEGTRGDLERGVLNKVSPPEGELVEKLVAEVRFVRNLGGFTATDYSRLFFASGPFSTLTVKTEPGLVQISINSDLHAVNNRVLFEGEALGDVEKALKGVSALRPYFSRVGLADLEKVFLDLGNLEEGEARVEGPYLLARGERWFLRRGLMLGDPELDRDLVFGKPVTLSFPEDVEFFLRASPKREGVQSPPKLELLEVGIRFKGEAVRFGAHSSPDDPYLRASPFPHVDLLQDDPVFRAIQAGLEKGLMSLERGTHSPFRAPLEACSSRMLAFLKVFVESKGPLRDLGEGRLQAYATAQLFADL